VTGQNQGGKAVECPLTPDPSPAKGEGDGSPNRVCQAKPARIKTSFDGQNLGPGLAGVEGQRGERLEHGHVADGMAVGQQVLVVADEAEGLGQGVAKFGAVDPHAVAVGQGAQGPVGARHAAVGGRFDDL